MPLFLLKLLGIGRWLKDAIGVVFRAILAHPKEAALIALACACVWLWRGWNGEQADHAATRLAHKAELQRIDLASAKSRADQEALFLENAGLNERIVANARLANARLAGAVDNALADYAARNRVRPASRCLGPAGAAPVPADPGAPPESTPAADMVAVTRDDFDNLGRAAMHGAEATWFLNELVAGGLAMEWPEPKLGR